MHSCSVFALVTFTSNAKTFGLLNYRNNWCICDVFSAFVLHEGPKHLTFLNYINNLYIYNVSSAFCLDYITYQNIWLYLTIEIICAFIMCLLYLFGINHLPKYFVFLNYRNNLCICQGQSLVQTKLGHGAPAQ